ncbi:PaaI family thioesterase [Intestinimonas massiliensis (ex Afouda et al. 2020)]|uniref:PaaI family thioesterase n=1 Tax=Intestinimonas massiliensis (ex Afouda et al. 2020) TaxID=1673721 RepID=UPI00102F64E8|nr:PaaI family thioesterase [Intestinimonas massiliensis (ex Afouda et al. 2020)]
MDSCSNRDYSGMLNKVNSGPYFGPKSGAVVTAIHGDHSAEGELEIRTDTQNPMGMVHGGALFTLADTVAGTAAFTTGRTCVTLDSSMQFLSAAKGNKVFCVAAPKKIGRTILVYDISMTDSENRLVATGIFTFYATGEYQPPKKN